MYGRERGPQFSPFDFIIQESGGKFNALFQVFGNFQKNAGNP
jgi:hypothetical protein